MMMQFETKAKTALSTTSAARTCGECGNGIVKAHRLQKGVPICTSCYHRIFIKVRCSRCGNWMVAHKNAPRPECHVCIVQDRSCLRCGKPVLRAGILIGDQAACASCAPYFREKKSCPRCGTLSARLSRVTGLSKAPVCEACQRQLSYATCTLCRKSRRQHSCRLDRKILCKTCTENPQASHACPDCGVEVGGYGENPCLSCAAARSLRKKQHFLSTTLSSEKTGTVLSEFVNWSIKAGHTARVSSGFAAYTEFFTRIDAHGGTISDAAIQRCFSVEELRRFGYVTQFLSAHGYLLSSSADRQDWSEERRIAEILNEANSMPCRELIVQYANWLGAKTGKPLAVRTKRMYLRAAISLLAHAAVATPSILGKAHLQSFLKKSPGQRASLTAFVHFLNEECELSVSVGPKKKKKGKSAISEKVDLVERLLLALQGDHPLKSKQAFLAKLLNTLYTIPLEKILDLPTDAVTVAGNELTLTVDGNMLQLDPRIVPFISSYLIDDALSKRSNEKLFQGRNTFDALSVSSISFHLKKLNSA